MTRPIALVLLAITLVEPVAQAGWWSQDNGTGLRPRGSQTPAVSGSFRAYKLTSTHGRTVTVRLPRPASLHEPVALPTGEWATITLLPDGPVTVNGLSVELDAITVPLADPAAAEIHLEWSLSDALTARLLSGDRSADLADQLGLALEDGALATP